jgi:hypothetical protein
MELLTHVAPGPMAETALRGPAENSPATCRTLRPGQPRFVQIDFIQVPDRKPGRRLFYEPVVVAVELVTPVAPAVLAALGALPAL